MSQYARMISQLKTPEVMKQLTYLYGPGTVCCLTRACATAAC